AFLSSRIFLAFFFSPSPYLELFSVMNLIATLACLAPFFAGAIQDISGSFTPAFLILTVPVLLILAVTLFMKPPTYPKFQHANEQEK
ncbi:MFS transporter, partial [Klebsiella variicola subsp. variicola]